MAEKIFRYSVTVSYLPFSTSYTRFYDNYADAEKEFNREWFSTAPSFNKHVSLDKVELHYENGECYYLRPIENIHRVKAS